MIKVKATKDVGPHVPSQADYITNDPEKSSRTPLFAGAFLAAVALYFQGIFPSWAAPAGVPDPAPKAEPAIDPQQHFAQAGAQDLTETVEPDQAGQDRTPANADQSTESSGGGRLINLRPPSPFRIADMPEPDLVALALSGPKQSDGSPELFPKATNDNMVMGVEGGSPADAGASAPPPATADGQGSHPAHQRTGNRVPRSSAAVQLADAVAGTAVLIALSDLLKNTSDADGDTLSVSNLRASSGTVTETAEGWVFRSTLPGPVSIIYQVDDGVVSTMQVARLAIRNPAFQGTDEGDMLVGTELADGINGGAGDDTIFSGTGDDLVSGSGGDDRVEAGADNDVILGGAGKDRLNGGDGDDRLNGGAGDDQLFGGNGNDLLVSEDGNDTLAGGAGNDLLYGDAGNDELSGGHGADYVLGGIGNDVLIGEADGAADTYSGGVGIDTLDFSTTKRGIIADLKRGAASSSEIGEDTIASVEIVYGGSGNDIIIGGAADETLVGNAGKDRITDGDGDDVVHGGAGADLIVAAADGQRDNFRGDAGKDIIDYSSVKSALLVNLSTGTAVGAETGADVISGFEAILGGSGDDTIIGSAGDETIVGAAGNDRLSDGAGKDVVHGGAGADLVIGAVDGQGDTFRGDAGADTLDYSSAASALMINLMTGGAVGAEIGADVISGFETILGGSGNDTVIGSVADETLFGNAGNDRITDGAGKDVIYGGAGADLIVAAADGVSDTLCGDAGIDTLDYSSSSSALMINIATGLASGVQIGSDTISGFEAVIGGSASDHFIIGGAPVVMKGGEGNDLFEFQAPIVQTQATQLFHEIIDIMIGDRIRLSGYELFKEVMDSVEDRFEEVYGDLDPDATQPIWVRHRVIEEISRTFIEADMDGDNNYETNIMLTGHHVLMIVEQSPAA